MGAKRSQQKIFFVESASAMSGVQYSTLYLSQHLNRGCWKSVVLCPEEGELARACRNAGVEVSILPRPVLSSTSIRVRFGTNVPNPLAWAHNFLGILVGARRLAQYLSLMGADLVVTKGMSSHFPGGLATKRLRIPCIWHVQDLVSERLLGIYRRTFCVLARWIPDQIIVDGSPIARQLFDSSHERISTVYNGVDTKVFRPSLEGSSVRQELGLPPAALVVGHVARMTPWKGQHHLLEAFVQIASRRSNVYVVFVGASLFDSPAYFRYLQKRVSELGIDHRVVFAGHRSDLPRVLAALDILAFTSTEKDTSPLALLSAMAVGVPVVAFDIEGVREVIGNEGEGRLVPVKNVTALAEALDRLLGDASLRERLASGARHRVETTFSLERYVLQMEAIFRRSLYGPPRTPNAC